MYLTTTECAELLGVSVHRVRFFIIQKRLPGQKKGRDWIVKERDLENFKATTRKIGRPKKE